MPDRSEKGIREGTVAVGPLQVLTHFGGEFEHRADGSIRGFEPMTAWSAKTLNSITETSSAP